MYHSMQWFGLYGMLGLVLQDAVSCSYYSVQCCVVQCTMYCMAASSGLCCLYCSVQWLVQLGCSAVSKGVYCSVQQLVVQ